MWNNSLYGNFRTRSFSQIFPNPEDFVNSVANSGINVLETESLTVLYFLLLARFKNWTIANSDESQFKYKMYSTIYMYGPTWEKRINIQKALRDMSEQELMTGAISIYNKAHAPETAPSTLDTEELDFVSDQNVNKYTRSKLDAYEYLYDVLKVDVSKSFIDRFTKLFNPFGQSQLPLYYDVED